MKIRDIIIEKNLMQESIKHNEIAVKEKNLKF